jgi:hypothetical protein
MAEILLLLLLGWIMGIIFACLIIILVLVPVQRTIMLYPIDSRPGRWAEDYSWADYLLWHYKVLLEDLRGWLKRKELKNEHKFK